MAILDEYLKPTYLCDFDKHPQIGKTALEIVKKETEKQEIVVAVFSYIKELPYGLEDWDVRASETLRKGWGMCSGKTNLMVAILRHLEIPSRYKVIRIVSEETLWNWITGQDGELARQAGNPAPEQDHVIAEVYTGKWKEYDPARDTAFETGLERLGIPLARKIADKNRGNYPIVLSSFDEWAAARQQSRRFRENRYEVFSRINTGIEKIRNL